MSDMALTYKSDYVTMPDGVRLAVSVWYCPLVSKGPCGSCHDLAAYVWGSSVRTLFIFCGASLDPSIATEVLPGRAFRHGRSFREIYGLRSRSPFSHY